MDYAVMWLILMALLAIAVLVILAAIAYWSVRQQWMLLRMQHESADNLQSAACELNYPDYPQYPVLSLDVPVGAPAPVSMELRLLQMTRDQPYCPICIVLRCTACGIPVESILPLLHGPHRYCEYHAHVLLAISGEWSYGPEV